jgi:hypothetical protein
MNSKLLAIAHSGVGQQIKIQIQGRKMYSKEIKTQNPNTLHNHTNTTSLKKHRGRVNTLTFVVDLVQGCVRACLLLS